EMNLGEKTAGEPTISNKLPGGCHFYDRFPVSFRTTQTTKRIINSITDLKSLNSQERPLTSKSFIRCQRRNQPRQTCSVRPPPASPAPQHSDVPCCISSFRIPTFPQPRHPRKGVNCCTGLTSQTPKEPQTWRISLRNANPPIFF